MKIKTKLIFDAFIAMLLMLLYKKNVISLAFHEAAGVILCLFIVVHLLLNKKWISAVTKGLFSKTTPARTRVLYAVDFLLALDFLFLLVTGIGISKKLFSSIAFIGNKGIPFHIFFGGLSVVLIGIHIGLHWNVIRAAITKNKAKPAARAAGIAVLAVLIGFGGYSLAKSSVPRWISLPFASSAQSAHGAMPSQTPAEPNSATAQSERGEQSRSNRPNDSEQVPTAGQAEKSAQRAQGKVRVQEPVTAKSVSKHILQFLSILVLFAAVTAFIDCLCRKNRRAVT